MPSNVVISDFDSMGRNFAENSKQVLCSASFGAGAYAIGGRLLGFPPLTVPSALVTGGALLASLALCPSGANEGAIFGQSPGFAGGQCSTFYDFTYSKSDDVITPPTGRIDANIAGPISEFNLTFQEGAPGIRLKRWAVSGVGAGGPFNIPDFAFTAAFGTCSVALVRSDNLPDDCGNPPRTGGQIISNTETGDTINNNTVVDNSNFSLVLPVEFNLGGISSTLNLQFGPIEIESLLPISFNINIGGSNYRFKQKPDGELEPIPTNPDRDGPDDKTQRLLRDIKECVCSPAVDLDMLLLPVVSDSDGCGLETETLLVPRGSVSDGQFQRFVSSANFAREGCMNQSVVQEPMTSIFSASTTQDGREIFTGIIEPNVASLVLKITDIREDGPPKIDLFPASNQRKFGSVSFVTDGVQGGGDYVYVFDTQTYIPLPSRGKNGRLRILMKKGLSFEVFDSGERL